MTLAARQLATAEARRAQLINILAALPELEIQELGEHLGIRIRKKSLAYYQFDHHGDGMISFVCWSTASEQRRLVRSDPETFFVPAYVGSRGWIGIRLDLDEVDWETVTDLIKRGYQAIAPKKLAARIDV